VIAGNGNGTRGNESLEWKSETGPSAHRRGPVVTGVESEKQRCVQAEGFTWRDSGYRDLP